MKRLLICLPILLFASSNKLSTHTELSYLQTGGNTDTKSFGLDFKGKQAWKKQKLTLDIDFVYAQTNDKETKNSLLTELSYQYNFSQHIDIAYLLGYKNDKFSGFDYQLYTGPGIEWKFIDTNKTKLNTHLYSLFSKDRYNSGLSDDYLSLRAGLVYSHQLYHNLKFEEEANIRSRADKVQNYFLYSRSSIYSKINSNFSLGITYKINYTNEPPSGKLKTDSTFLVSFVVDY